MKLEKYLATTTPMYEALFYEDSNNEFLPESSAEACHLSIKALVVSDCDSDEPCDEDDDDYDDVCEDKPRTLNEIYEELSTIRKQVWYSRHMNRRWQIEVGEVKVVSSAEWHAKKYDRLKYPESQSYILEENWDAAQRSAEKVEGELGEENLGPLTDFELGMINGKLSALRWSVGNDWDFLDVVLY
ncbi:hypothetical protein PQR46_19095 [Paraburkholderia sediminicola]|uniref:hypothetical protein n=1 Tax=Paraburkholderia sediminicola TaxID=458836 RepID=UPI0038B7B184